MQTVAAGADRANPFPTITFSDDHPHKLRTMVRHRESGRLYRVLGLVLWADHIDHCDEVIAAPVDEPTAWAHFLEFELEAA